MQRRDLFLGWLGLLLACLLAGCGGGSVGTGDSGTRTAAVKVSVNWAARSRALSGPSSALSAVITLKGAAQDGTDFSFIVNRSGDTAAHTENYTSTNLANVGRWSFQADFHAQETGNGAIVGTARATITLNADGTGIGDIATTGTIASVVIPPGQFVTVGQTKELVFTALDSAGAILPVTAGSAFVTVNSGGDKLAASGPSLTGLAVGNASITATVDGKSSAPTSIAVVASTTAPLYDVSSFGIAGVSSATAINQQGQVVGQTSALPFFWNGTTLLSLSLMQRANDVNDQGTAAGTARIGLSNHQAFTQNGIIGQGLGTLPNGTNSEAFAINNSDIVVGVSDFAASPLGVTVQRGFVWQSGHMTNIGSLPGKIHSRATDINLSGQVVGISYNTSADAHAFLWQTGTLYDLGAAYDGDPPRIIDSGLICFTELDANGNRQAVQYQNAHDVVLGTLSGDDFSGATGLNSRGDVIGYSLKLGGTPVPVLFRDGVVISLNTRIATNGWTLVSAAGIDDTGRIAGTATASGVNQAVLLTPR